MNHFGDAYCDACARGEQCFACAAVTGGEGTLRTDRTRDGHIRCGRCASNAVDTTADLERAVPPVRSYLEGIGLPFPHKLPIRFAAPEEMSLGPGCLGHTVVVQVGRVTTVNEVKIVSGLPFTLFGRVLSHEIAHAWLARCPYVPATHSDEEGMCELVGSWWLHFRGGDYAQYLLDAMARNPDPIYGGGYRAVAERFAGMSPSKVIHLVNQGAA